MLLLALALIAVLTFSACDHEHVWSEWTTVKSATCTENGMEERTCDCGEVETREINATGHCFGNWETVTKATCTEKGKKVRSCSCGETQEQEIAAKGHSFGAWVTVSGATCTVDGEQKHTCHCGAYEVKKIPATGHVMQEATCTEPASCIYCDYTEGKALGHINNNGYCDRCGEKITIDMKTVIGKPDECSTTSYFGFCYYKNSANGIKVCWGGENLSGKTINYYTVTIYFYNSVGDPAYSEITGKSSKTVKFVGPVKPNGDLLIYGIVDYVPVCSKVLIGEITVEYSDGTSDTGWYGWYTTYKNSAIK